MFPDLKLPPEGKRFYTHEQYQQDASRSDPPKTFAYTFFDAFEKALSQWDPPSIGRGERTDLSDICRIANSRDFRLRSAAAEALDKFLVENDGEISQWPDPKVGLQIAIKTDARIRTGTDVEEYSYSSAPYYVPFDFFGTEYDAPYGVRGELVDGFFRPERKSPGHKFKGEYNYQETDAFKEADRKESELKRQIYPIWQWLLARVALCLSLLPGLFATVMCVVFIVWGVTGKDPETMADNLITTYYDLVLKSGYLFFELLLFIGGWLLTALLISICNAYDASDIAFSPFPSKAKAMYDAFHPEYERLQEQEQARQKAYVALTRQWQEAWYKTYVARQSGKR